MMGMKTDIPPAHARWSCRFSVRSPVGGQFDCHAYDVRVRFVYGTIAWKTASNQASRRVRTVSQLASICLATAASTAG